MPTRRRSDTASTVGCGDVVAVEEDLAGHAEAGDQVIHPVEAAQEGALAAA